MRCHILDEILEQKKRILEEKTGEMQISCSLVNYYCTNVDFLVLIIVLWLCKMLILGETE